MAAEDSQLPGNFGLPATSQLYVAGMRIEDAIAQKPTDPTLPQEAPVQAAIAKATPTTVKPQVVNDHRFWASPPQSLLYRFSDGIQINLSKAKKINYLSLDLPAFPHHFYFHWWDAARKEWREFKGLSGGSIRIYIDKSAPAVVGTAAAYQAKQHPSHYGAGHWMHYDVDVHPITTSKIRIRGNRNFGSRHGGPKDPYGRPAKYSLGVRNFDFGWRVLKKNDVPRTPRDPDILTETESFTQVYDLLGSPVELKMRENRASDLLRGSPWKCEPQPVPYAVVNFYVDARDPAGQPQVIDRFNITPLQAGANLNLYYSTDVPDADFGASDAPIVFPALRTAGNVQPQAQPSGILFENKISYLDLSNQAVGWDPAKPFWFGLEFQPQWDSSDVTPHVIFDTGALQLAWNEGVFRLQYNGGGLHQQPLAFSVNSRLRAFVSFDGERLTFFMPETGAAANTAADAVEGVSEAIRFGAEIGDSTAPVVFTGRFRLNAFVLKQEKLTFVKSDDAGLIVPDPVQRFMAGADAYLDKPEYRTDDDGSTDNALVRYLPRFRVGVGAASANPYGFVGGPGTIYEDVVWTPVLRDYKLRAGMLQFMPTRARFFKFEFSNLTPEPYQTFAPVTRTVKTYSDRAVKPASSPQLTSQIKQSASSAGLTANADATQGYSQFADTPAITNPPTADVSPTEALTARDLGTQSSLNALGSMYRFDSWQPGTAAPVYPETAKHYYEEVEVVHNKRIAYFVGISKLEMFRVDYSADDDTEQYIDQFDDVNNIDPAYLTEKVVVGTTNLVTNPSFEDGITGHTLYVNGTATDGAIATVADGLFGDDALRVSATTLGATSGDRVGWQATYTDADFSASVVYSIHAKRVAGDALLRLHVEYYDGSAAFISSATETFEPTNDWARYSAKMLPPLATESAKVYWWLEAGGGAAVEYRFDGYQIEDLHLTDYCDGDQEGCAWTGTPHESTSVRESVSIHPWGWDGDRLRTGSDVPVPSVTTSRRFASRRRVRGVQFATQQSQAVQLLDDPDFLDPDLAKAWVSQGDVLAMGHTEDVTSTIGQAVRIDRSSARNTWAEVRETYQTWGLIESGDPDPQQPTFSDLEGGEGAVGYGGVAARRAVQVTESGRVWAAARVYADHTMKDPLTLQIVSHHGDVLAEKSQVVQAGRVVEWSVPYTVGELPSPTQTWADVMRRETEDDPTEPTYGQLQGLKWADLMDVEIANSRQLSVRVIQRGAGEDYWYMDSLALFEDPIKWEFSNDDGKTWWPALDIRNDPRGVLIFPNSTDPFPTDPTGLRWRVTGYRENLHVSSLNIRPWYAETVFGIPRREPGVSGGPNIQPTDHYPAITDDPMFKQWSDPIPQDWYFVYRQLLLLNREYVPVDTIIKPDLFASPQNLLVDTEIIVPPPTHLDIYTGDYTGEYGVPNETGGGQGVYVDDYEPEDDY